jgi:hypothetical protein
LVCWGPTPKQPKYFGYYPSEDRDFTTENLETALRLYSRDQANTVLTGVLNQGITRGLALGRHNAYHEFHRSVFMHQGFSGTDFQYLFPFLPDGLKGWYLNTMHYDIVTGHVNLGP